ncbi:hypothetical protein RRG08_040203 [Elysia crispata]|uniref:Uncharacterized protein n=1 Tax=Elysia crispata TaxID=231223 RepID=A0AAE1CNN3_9GAST|nr:hypothetical protein RRG08_040203 [Elysia crispata]
MTQTYPNTRFPSGKAKPYSWVTQAWMVRLLVIGKVNFSYNGGLEEQAALSDQLSARDTDNQHGRLSCSGSPRPSKDHMTVT